MHHLIAFRMIVTTRQTIAIGLVIGLLAATSNSYAHDADIEAEPNPYLVRETIDDPEEVDGDFDERVRAMQEWLSKREAERRRQGLELDAPVAEEPAVSSSTYFEAHGYDELGFRRLDGNVRVRLRGLQDDRQTHRVLRHSSRHQSRQQAATTRKGSKAVTPVPPAKSTNKTFSSGKPKTNSQARK